ncbi:MAG: hypothetical protein WEE64_04285 [Dehalococcoidia bacterium]
MQDPGGRAEDQMMTVRRRRGATNAGIVLALATCGLALAAVACNGTLGGGDSPEPPASALESETFLAPVEDARALGIEPYWLGQEIEAGGIQFKASGVARVYGDEEDARLNMQYSGDVGNGFVGLGLDSYATRGSSFRERMNQALAEPGATSEAVRVGNHQGTLVVLPGGRRPVNTLLLLVSVDEATVVVWAKAGSTGVPGTDGNPLIDKDLLIQVVAENLQPIPE